MKWQSIKLPPPLPRSEVHLWAIPLAILPEVLPFYDFVLSSEERARANRFKQTEAARNFVVTRGSLRRLLGLYLVTEPGELVFANETLGKPRLIEPATHAGNGFNVSHSHDYALLGFVRDKNIGVDLEFINDRVECEELAKRFFSLKEYQDLVALPKDQRLEAFYTAWTGKEAYLKARGAGLASELNRVEIEMPLGQAATSFRSLDDENISKCWTLRHFMPAPCYLAAVAVESKDAVFKYFTWQSTRE